MWLAIEWAYEELLLLFIEMWVWLFVHHIHNSATSFFTRQGGSTFWQGGSDCNFSARKKRRWHIFFSRAITHKNLLGTVQMTGSNLFLQKPFFLKLTNLPGQSVEWTAVYHFELCMQAVSRLWSNPFIEDGKYDMTLCKSYICPLSSKPLNTQSVTRNTACQHRREAIKCKNISSLLNTTLMGYNMPFFTPFWQPNNGKKVVEFSGSRCLFLTREWHPLPSFFWSEREGCVVGLGWIFDRSQNIMDGSGLIFWSV